MGMCQRCSAGLSRSRMRGSRIITFLRVIVYPILSSLFAPTPGDAAQGSEKKTPPCQTRRARLVGRLGASARPALHVVLRRLARRRSRGLLMHLRAGRDGRACLSRPVIRAPSGGCVWPYMFLLQASGMRTALRLQWGEKHVKRTKSSSRDPGPNWTRRPASWNALNGLSPFEKSPPNTALRPHGTQAVAEKA